ncbi:hypothetical protein H5P36_17545 [Bacillus sp. APMAM]|nr:hypothetical protein [Bacillus sp. APMAM]RTZ54651.1 hypothetical protein EKO25_16780 [Bacillus sp. SAJ1]
MECLKKVDLILDIAGVIATNFSPIFWRDLSIKFGIIYDDLIEFKNEIRKDLWTGKIDDQEFWDRFLKKFPTIDIVYAKTKLLAVIKPLPALAEIPKWSKYANIHLLSNHRIEWVNHIIIPVEKYIRSITISSDIGLCKPQVEIYLKVNLHLNNQHCVLFVDDQEKN